MDGGNLTDYELLMHRHLSLLKHLQNNGVMVKHVENAGWRMEIIPAPVDFLDANFARLDAAAIRDCGTYLIPEGSKYVARTGRPAALDKDAP